MQVYILLNFIKIVLHIRKSSVLTHEDRLETLFSFPNFPVYAGCVSSPEIEDNLLDLQVDICKDTGILQLKHVPSIEQVYLFAHNDAIGRTWKEHNEQFANFIRKFEPTKVLEIGGGSGKLAKICLEKNKNYDWTILDPNPLYEDESTLHSIKKYFSSDIKFEDDFDMIVHSHVIEHILNPQQFLKDISKYLVPGNLHIFSFPNMKVWLQKKYLNCIMFEHSIFLIEDYLDIMLKKIGFKIIEKFYFKDDHSIFYATKFIGNPIDADFPNLYQKNKILYSEFIKYYQNFVKEINSKINNFPGKVYLFGAHLFSQYLLSFGLNQNKIDGILDNSSLKIGKRLYGSKLKVFHPDHIKNEKCVIILKVGSYHDEIIEQLKQINPSAEVYQ